MATFQAAGENLSLPIGFQACVKCLHNRGVLSNPFMQKHDNLHVCEEEADRTLVLNWQPQAGCISSLSNSPPGHITAHQALPSRHSMIGAEASAAKLGGRHNWH